MAREINQIETQIINSIQNNATLGSLLTSPSATAIWRLWAFIVATSQGIEEQLYDQFLLDTESVIAMAAPMTPKWLQNQVLNFQYNVSTPQVIQLDATTFAPVWPTVDPSLRIVSRCSVTRGILSSVNIKVAKNNPPEALGSTELNALQSFVNTVGAAGIIYNVISLNPDQMSVQATVYYKGVYSSVIAANLLAAYNNLLLNLPFDGVIKITDITTALLAVTGVNDVVLNNVTVRPDAVAWGGGTNLILSNTELFKQWQTLGGYIQDEVTSGQDFLSRLVLVSQ